MSEWALFAFVAFTILGIGTVFGLFAVGLRVALKQFYGF